MTGLEKLKLLENNIKSFAPSFKVKFKDESNFMKILSKILFFNKNFMTGYITTIGTRVYFPNKIDYYNNPNNSFKVLAHEGIHVLDYVKNPFKFIFLYLSPQILALLSIFSVLSFISPYFLLFLLSLLFVLPIPSLGRAYLEKRGYGMSIKVEQWDKNTVVEKYIEEYIYLNFTGPDYYYMFPFKNKIIKDLKEFLKDDSCIADINPIYKVVYNITHENL